MFEHIKIARIMTADLKHRQYSGGSIRLTPKELGRADGRWTVVVRPQAGGGWMVAVVNIENGLPMNQRVVYVDDREEVRVAIHDQLRMLDKMGGTPGHLSDRARMRFWE